MADVKPGHRLGALLRATRLGYRQVPDRAYFLRVRDEGELFLLDFAPLGGPIPTGPGRRPGMHRCWWEGEAQEIVGVRPIVNVLTVKRPFTMRIDEHGNVVRRG